MASACIESQYCPPIETFARLVMFDRLWIEGAEHFVKGTYRNRCYISGPNGKLRLSVPLSHSRRGHSRMDQLKIAYEEEWQRIHWDSFCSCYRSSPYFEYYEDRFSRIFHQRYELLTQLNTAVFNWLLTQFELDLQIKFTEFYHTQMPPGIADLRGAVHPKSEKARSDAFYNNPEYPQVFDARNGFIPGLSALDLLFNEGPQSGEIIRASSGREPVQKELN